MKRRIFIVINILLLSLILFEGWHFYRVWSAESALSFIETGDAVLIKPSPAAGRMAGKPDKKENTSQDILSGKSFETEGEKLLPLRESYEGVIEKNIFHTQRREGAEEIKIELPSASTTTAILKPKPRPINLEGIVIFGNYKAAIIKDTATQSKTGRQTRRVRVGDMIEDQKVIAIMENRIIVKGEEGERVIKLHDSDKPSRLQMTVRPEGAPAQGIPAEKPPAQSPPPAP